jgi:transcription initiation factor TFIIIB Brf1 subunit/transcription initiation factor TFIIB
MPKPKIDRVKLNQLLKAGKSQREVAQVFGVTEGAISKAKKELNFAVVKNVTLESAHKVVYKNLDAIQQLQRINRVANQFLNELIGDDKTIDRMVKAVEAVLQYEDEPKKQKAYIRQVILQLNKDRNLALKTCAEIGNQLKIQLDIFKVAWDMETVREFQAEVLSAIAEVSPELRSKIIERLKKSRALRTSVQIS